MTSHLGSDNTEKASGQILVPSLDASWETRKKSSHFKLYGETAKNLQTFLNLMIGLLTYNRRCSDINFREKRRRMFSKNVEEVLNEIKRNTIWN